MNKVFEKILERLDETDFNDIQMVVREVLLKYGFPYESVVQDEVWDALDELSTNKFAKQIVKEVAEVYNGGWIPCSEMLPSGLDFVLYTHKDGEVDICSIEYFYDYLDRFTAWQPLPEPYQPKGE